MFTLMFAAGYLALLPLIIPATVWLRYVTWISRQPPGQRVELTKASHGAGMLALSGSIVFLAHGQGAAVSSMPLLWVPLGIMVIWGALWLVTSGLQARLYGSQGPLDTVLLVRSMVKVGIGVAIAHFIPFQSSQLLAALPRIADLTGIVFALLCLAGWFVAWWCVFTGAAKILLLLLTRIRGRARRTPKPTQNPRGDARNASRAEARNAMRGLGGMTSKLDEREF